jgi:ribosome-binding factor A
MARRRPTDRDPPAGPSPRQLRAGEAIRRALIKALAEAHFRDPDLAAASITVTEVRASPDLKHGFCFVIPLGGRDAAKILAALKRASGYLRTEVARRVQLRVAPELHFELDRSFDEGARIDSLLRSPGVRRDVGEG